MPFDRVCPRRRGTKFVAALLIAAVGAWSAAFNFASAGTPEVSSITGVIRDSHGAPVPLAFATATVIPHGMQYSAITGRSGGYRLGPLPAGTYHLLAHKPEYRGVPQRERLRGLAINRLVLPLTYVGLSVSQITPSDWMSMMPAGKGLYNIELECQGCHSLERIYRARMSQADWRATINRMSEAVLQGGAGEVVVPEKEVDTMAAYLARNFGPQTPPATIDPKALAKTPPLDIAAAAARFVEYPIPSDSWAHDGALDHRGNYWYGGFKSGRLGRVNIATGEVKEWSVPGANAHPHGVTVDRRTGLVWVADLGDGTIDIFNPSAQKFAVLNPPTPGSGPHTFTWDRGGNLWYTGALKAVFAKIDVRTRKITEYKVPTPRSIPYGIAVDDKRGLVYVCEFAVGKIARLHIDTGVIDEIPTPPTDNPTGTAPRRSALDAGGNLWFAEYNVGKLAELITGTRRIVEYPLPTPNSGPYTVYFDGRRNRLFVSEFYADRIAEFDPNTRRFIEYPLPTTGTRIRDLDMDAHGNLWFPEFGTDKVGMMSSDSRE